MCGRFSLSSAPAQLALELDAVDEASAPPVGLHPDTAPPTPRFNIAPTTTVPVLTLDVPRESLDEAVGPAAPRRVLRAMRWGLVPSWTKESQRLPTLFNARVETAASKPAFRAAVARRHCVVPMTAGTSGYPVNPPPRAPRRSPSSRTS